MPAVTPADPVVALVTAAILRALEDEAGALDALDAAFAEAANAHDAPGSAAIAGAACCIIGSSWGNLAPLALWGERVRNASLPGRQQPACRLLLLAGWLYHHSIARTAVDADCAAAYARQLNELLRSPKPPLPADLAVLGSEPLLDLLAQAGELAAFEDVATLAERAYVDADPRLVGRNLFWRGNNLRVLDLPERAQQCFDGAESLATQTGWYWLRLQALRASVRPAIEGRDTARIEALLETNRQLLRPDRPADWGDYHHLRGWDALLREDGRVARLHYRQSIDNYVAAALPVHMLGVMRGGEAAALILLGQGAAAAAAFAEVPAMDNERGRSVKIANVALALAWHARQIQEQDYLGHLRQGFAAAARFDLKQVFRALPGQLAELCADALQHDIEPVFVRKLVFARRLSVPSSATAAWPWALKVHTLGPFTMTVRGTLLEFTGKVQNKPLDLVRLLASNDGQPLAVNSVVAALWSDSEGDAGRKAFDATLARLKKLVGADDWIVVDAGKLQLNPAAVWIDAVELGHLANRVDALALPALHDTELRNLSAAVLRIYAAPFLVQEPETSWLLEARERNKHRFVRTLDRLGTEFERRGLIDDAVQLFDRGTEIEPIAETFYRRLMLAHELRGNVAEAMRVYRRCRDMLSILLSIPPSRATQAIVERLYRPET